MSDYDDYVKEVINDLNMYGEFNPLMPEMIQVLWDNGLVVIGKMKGCKFYKSISGICMRMFLNCIDDNGNDVECEVSWVRSNYWDPRDVTKTHILHSIDIIK